MTFRNDASRFELVFSGNTDLDAMPGYLFLPSGNRLDRTVYVEGDLDTGNTRNENLDGFWVVNGTVTLRPGDTISGQLRCRGLVGSSPSPNIHVSGRARPSPCVYVYDPLSENGAEYYRNHASTHVVLNGNNATVTLPVVGGSYGAPTTTPLVIQISDPSGTPLLSENYVIKKDQNVLVFSGGSVTVIGNGPAIAAPLTIVSLKNASSGGNATVSGSFSYRRFVYRDSGGTQTADNTMVLESRTAFGYLYDLLGWEGSYPASASFSLFAEENLFFENGSYVGLYYGGNSVQLADPTCVVDISGTVYGRKIMGSGTGLTVHADAMIGVFPPRYFPCRPGFVTIERYRDAIRGYEDSGMRFNL